MRSRLLMTLALGAGLLTATACGPTDDADPTPAPVTTSSAAEAQAETAVEEATPAPSAEAPASADLEVPAEWPEWGYLPWGCTELVYAAVGERAVYLYYSCGDPSAEIEGFHLASAQQEGWTLVYHDAGEGAGWMPDGDPDKGVQVRTTTEHGATLESIAGLG